MKRLKSRGFSTAILYFMPEREQIKKIGHRQNSETKILTNKQTKMQPCIQNDNGIQETYSKSHMYNWQLSVSA